MEHSLTPCVATRINLSLGIQKVKKKFSLAYKILLQNLSCKHNIIELKSLKRGYYAKNARYLLFVCHIIMRVVGNKCVKSKKLIIAPDNLRS